MKYTYQKPRPVCGLVPVKWTDSIHYDADFAGVRQVMDLPPQEITTRFLSKEMVQVPAGKFNTAVFEQQTKWTDNQGSSVIQVVLTYVAENIGIIKEITVRIQKARIIEYEKNKEMDEQIAKGLADLQQGKKITEIDFLKIRWHKIPRK